MKIDAAVDTMTKLYLKRVLDSVNGYVGSVDTEEARELIQDHSDDLADEDRIREELTFEKTPIGKRILYRYILQALLNSPHWSDSLERIHDKVERREEALLEAAHDEDALKYSSSKDVDILEAILEVAVEDEEISPDEISLINRLRRKLNLSEREQNIVLAQLDHFPRSGNRLHTYDEVKDALQALERKGIVFHCNRHPDGKQYVIPDEIGPGVKEALGVDLSEKGWELLLENLTKDQLYEILDANDLPVAGRKDELIQRVMEAHLRPLKSLKILYRDDLYDICEKLDLKVRGSKQEKAERIIDHFSNIVIKEPDDPEAPAALYCEYLEELAAREHDTLRHADVIDKDIDIERAFEEGTRYLFEAKLGLEVIELEGAERPDGALRFEDGKGLLMWDNKSKEEVYRFPRGHLRQFRRYIRNSKDNVSAFLVIVPEVGDDAVETAFELKAETDTDIALITAEDLKWVGENWPDYSSGDEFQLEVFNRPGVLDRSSLKRHMKVLL